MSTYNGTCRTNYFRVNDEEKYQELFSQLTADCEISDFSKTREDGESVHGFGCYGSIGYKENTDGIEEFLQELQTILPEDEAFIYLESGYEKLRYIVGECWVVTNKEICYLNIDTLAKAKAKELLGEDFETETMY